MGVISLISINFRACKFNVYIEQKSKFRLLWMSLAQRQRVRRVLLSLFFKIDRSTLP
jgi:hypothetical protein